ncbi:hypothetical protein Pcinc_016936 [Petrolisthes cinctipes]|uniref:Uncharacterized protein n=1 Tax=Petrolisthes cinctipes TaxID=88211 RepID=A0AAE1FPY1_PETCI|nr:hypothetical protein Pcinc_016936 [Petrolisthes cinctipes]
MAGKHHLFLSPVCRPLSPFDSKSKDGVSEVRNWCIWEHFVHHLLVSTSIHSRLQPPSCTAPLSTGNFLLFTRQSVTFTIQTDHMRLVHAFTRQTDTWPPRQH